MATMIDDQANKIKPGTPHQLNPSHEWTPFGGVAGGFPSGCACSVRESEGDGAAGGLDSCGSALDFLAAEGDAGG
jgi:hypothetical protein